MSDEQRALNVYAMERLKFISTAMLADNSDRSAYDKYRAAERAWGEGVERGETGAPAELFEPSEFKPYRRKQIAELRPYVNGENLIDVSISREDVKAGSPKAGDMIARNPANHADQWLVAKAYYEANFEEMDAP